MATMNDEIRFNKLMALCVTCNHEKLHHSGGLGMCSVRDHGHFCRCNQFRTRKNTKETPMKKLAKTVRKRLETLAADTISKTDGDTLRREAKAVEKVIAIWPVERAPLSKDYRVATVNGRSVIMLRKFNVVVAEFADNTASAVDFFTDILGT